MHNIPNITRSVLALAWLCASQPYFDSAGLTILVTASELHSELPTFLFNVMGLLGA
jgi:hypothetical protein